LLPGRDIRVAPVLVLCPACILGQCSSTHLLMVLSWGIFVESTSIYFSCQACKLMRVPLQLDVCRRELSCVSLQCRDRNRGKNAAQYRFPSSAGRTVSQHAYPTGPEKPDRMMEDRQPPPTPPRKKSPQVRFTPASVYRRRSHQPDQLKDGSVHLLDYVWSVADFVRSDPLRELW
jgi:hypothetical protein